MATVGFAQDNAARSIPTTGRRAPSGILAGAHNALEKLVTQGTINQQQADAVQRQANAGSIDPKTLVQRGVVSDAQMRAIGNRIDKVRSPQQEPSGRPWTRTILGSAAMSHVLSW